jgi:hypothetical protein
MGRVPGGLVRRATWGIVAGVIGTVLGALLLTRWTRTLTSLPSAWDPLLSAHEIEVECARMAEGIV